MAWTKSPDQDCSTDGRGWPKNKLRHYSELDEQRVLQIYQELDSDPRAYFTGASAILQHYRQCYPHTQPLSLRFIGRTLSKYGLTKPPEHRRHGASRYLHYPEYSINQLGGSLMEIDFIGKKFIRGRTEPINFIAFSLRFPRKLKYFQRIASETADEVIHHCQDFFTRFEKPEIVKIDNGFAFAGASRWPRTVSKVAIFLLKEQVIPVFTAPRKPWNQASVEGANSIFARKFWRRFQFTSLEEIDDKLEGFNSAYQRYLGYMPPQQSVQPHRSFVPTLYFIRKVYEDPQTGQGFVEVVKEHIALPEAYINFFTLIKWNLVREELMVCFQDEQKLKPIHQRSLKINRQSSSS